MASLVSLLPKKPILFLGYFCIYVILIYFLVRSGSREVFWSCKRQIPWSERSLPEFFFFFNTFFFYLRSTLERVPSEFPGPLHRDPTPCAPLGEVFEKCCVSYLASQIGRKTGATGHLRVLCAVMLKYLRHLLINPLIAAAIPGGLWDHGFEQKLSGGNPILLTLSFKYAVFVLARRLTKRAHTCVYAHTRSHIQTLKKNI